jgi:hypothetical protein
MSSNTFRPQDVDSYVYDYIFFRFYFSINFSGTEYNVNTSKTETVACEHGNENNFWKMICFVVCYILFICVCTVLCFLEFI